MTLNASATRADFGPIDPRHARDALHAIDPGCPRDEWHAIGRAAIAAGLTVDDVVQWSEPAPNYSGERDVRSAFRTIKPDGGTTAATLWRAALDAGWKPPHDDAKPAGMGSPGRQHKARQEPAKAPRWPSAAEVWARCKPATEEHPYIVAKQGRAAGLRVVPEGDALRIAGASVAGWLVVPVLPLAGGEPVSLQFIPPPGAGKKLNLPGASMGGVFTVGELAQAGTVYLCEGIGQAWACWQATGAAAVACFGWGRVRAVAQELRQRDAGARLVLVPDAGKEQDADGIARALGAQVAELPAGESANFDANDYAQREGLDALEVLLSAPAAPEQRYKLLSSADLRAIPPVAWRVRGVLPAQGVVSIYGPSSSGKSFLALDLAAAIAQGCGWFGHKVKPAPVVYAVLEGQGGFRLRVAAWETANGATLPDGLRVMSQTFKLTEPQDVRDLAAAALSMGNGAVVFIDTQNAAAPGVDENSSADMGRLIEAAKELQRLTGGLVVLVHHTGKDLTKGLRGHSSLIAALDAALEVWREGDRREWRLFKAKDGEDGAVHAFRLAVVELGEDEDGELVTSCVVRATEAPEDATRARLPKGGNQRVVLDALGELLRKSATYGRSTAPSHRPCVEVEAAVEAIAPRLLCEPARKKERTRLALTGLVAAGVVTCRDGWLWLP